MWGDIMDSVEKAEKVAQEFEDEVNDLRVLVDGNIDEGPSVFYSIFEMWAAGPNTLIGEVVDLLHDKARLTDWLATVPDPPPLEPS